MGFWTTDKLKKNIENIIILHDVNKIKNCSYELTLGREAYITSRNTDKKTTLKFFGDSIRIPPGQFSILLTEEIVKIPDTAIGLISIKAGIKFKGLVNVSGFHVDPGYYGRLKFAVYNAGSKDINLVRGQSVFLLWLSDLTEKTDDLYNNGRYKENTISSENLDALVDNVASPAQLRIEIGELKNNYTNLENELKSFKSTFHAAIGAGITILVTILAAVLSK